MLLHLRKSHSPNSLHYDIEPAVLIAAERGLHEEDETKGQEEPLAPCPTPDFNVLMYQIKTELASVPHGRLGASEKADDPRARSERMVAIIGSRAQQKTGLLKIAQLSCSYEPGTALNTFHAPSHLILSMGV